MKKFLVTVEYADGDVLKKEFFDSNICLRFMALRLQSDDVKTVKAEVICENDKR